MYTSGTVLISQLILNYYVLSNDNEWERKYSPMITDFQNQHLHTKVANQRLRNDCRCLLHFVVSLFLSRDGTFATEFITAKNSDIF